MASEFTEITKSILEEAKKSTVEKFVVNVGAQLGDDYTCISYLVDVWLTSNKEPLPLLVKC